MSKLAGDVTRKDWSETGFARTAAVLGERAGLVFPQSRRAYAEQAMREVMQRLGEGNSRALAARIHNDAEALAQLITQVTIGETYFYREPSQLEYIRRTVLPLLARSRAADKPLRVWSAGCATGEEPYTLAIILQEDLPRQQVQIVGTEVSHERLAAARRARYGRWSLRTLSDPVIRRYFSSNGKHFVLRPDIRAMVDFGYLNLADSDYSGASLNLSSMDLILCRNVLIYLDRETVAAVAQRLLNSLSEDGWLFLGASDPVLMDLVACEVVVTGAGLAYRRPASRRWSGHDPAGVAEPVSAIASVVAQGMYTTLQDGAPDAWSVPLETLAAALPDVSTVVAQPHPDLDAGSAEHTTVAAPAPVPDTIDSVRAHYQAQDYASAVRAAVNSMNAGVEDAEIRVLLVRSLANSGSLADAGRACAAAIDVHPTHAELAYLHALLLSAAGRLEESLAAVRGALFLDRKLIVAHMLMGGLLARMNDSSAALRSFRNVSQLLDGVPQDSPVAASDGEPAGRIREAARVQAELLAGDR